MNELELDLLKVARAAASSGVGSARSSVMTLTRKYGGTELGTHLRRICEDHRIPLEVDRVSAPAEAGVNTREVLRASEAMDALRVLSRGDAERFQDFKVAMDFALGDFGAKFANGQLQLLVKKGEEEAAAVIAAFLVEDKRKTYAEAGRRFIAARVVR